MSNCDFYIDGCFKPVVLVDHKIDALPIYSCDTKSKVIICCLDEDGNNE